MNSRQAEGNEETCLKPGKGIEKKVILRLGVNVSEAKAEVRKEWHEEKILMRKGKGEEGK